MGGGDVKREIQGISMVSLQGAKRRNNPKTSIGGTFQSRITSPPFPEGNLYTLPLNGGGMGGGDIKRVARGDLKIPLSQRRQKKGEINDQKRFTDYP
jgi:hypothetical protein